MISRANLMDDEADMDEFRINDNQPAACVQMVLIKKLFI